MMMEALERAELESYYEFFGIEQGSIISDETNPMDDNLSEERNLFQSTHEEEEI